MTERDRRLHRLLAVRTLQADLAAAHLRGLRQQETTRRDERTHWQHKAQLAITPAATHDSWLLSCAEAQLAGVRAARVSAELEEAVALVAEHTLTEQAQRVAREQIDRLCTRSSAVAARLSALAEQARLDDLFNAAAVRQKALAGKREVT